MSVQPPAAYISMIRSYSGGSANAISNLPASCRRPATNAPSGYSTGTRWARRSLRTATAAECMLKRDMDQPGGILTRFQTRAIDIPNTALRSLLVPRRETARRIELMLPRRAYNAEFTRWRTLAATTVSFSIRSPSTTKETSSSASVERSRVRIGENGGNDPSDWSVFCFRTCSGDAVWLSVTTPGLSTRTAGV